jgi:hypothetical protein
MSQSVSFTEGINNSMGQGFSNYGSSSFVSGSKDFLMSNTIVAKLAFLLLVIIGFVLCLRISTQVILWLHKPDPNPYVVTCRRDGQLTKVIPGDPKIKNSIPILRSKNEREGVEFTWSVWLYIDKAHTPSENGSDRYYHVFHKGTKGARGILGLQNHDAGPGLYIKSSKNTVGGNTELKNSLVAVMNTFSGQIENDLKVDGETIIEDIPIRKWFHVALRVEQKNFDVYVNGILYKRRVLPSLPRQNYGDIHLAQSDMCDSGNGCGNEQGFQGEISSLRYFNNALNPVEIGNIVKVGPNMCADDSSSQYPPYFSTRWYNL